MKNVPLTYQSAGVNYDVLDTFKRACQRAAASTVDNLSPHGYAEPAAIRGESSYVIEAADHYLAHVEEALGTKILVADAMYKLTGDATFYRNIAIDDVATIANDLCACGALAEGFAEGCRLSGAVWSGGETQALKGMVVPGTCILGGSAIGRIAPKHHRIQGNVADGDVMIFLASSGVQTNGLTLCRAVAERLPQGYLTPIRDGRTYGAALLDASVIYVRFVAACQQAGIPLHYTAHMTGHGWRKLMRLDEPFVYRVESVPEPQPVFAQIRETAGLDNREMYGTFNMGVGFVAFVAPADAERTLAAARSAGYTAWRGGTVGQEGTKKAVEIPALGLTYGADTLHIR
jgi:phosphoribosylformylglycinamidine cyclo-ligase